MKKKELKRLLKLCESDLNSMADEAIYYKGRAQKAEAFIERLFIVGNNLDFIAAQYEESIKWLELRDEWRANPPKDYRDRDNA